MIVLINIGKWLLKAAFFLALCAFLNISAMIGKAQASESEEFVQAANSCYIAMAIEELAFDNMDKIWDKMTYTWDVVEIQRLKAEFKEASVIASKASNRRRVLCAQAAAM